MAPDKSQKDLVAVGFKIKFALPEDLAKRKDGITCPSDQWNQLMAERPRVICSFREDVVKSIISHLRAYKLLSTCKTYNVFIRNNCTLTGPIHVDPVQFKLRLETRLKWNKAFLRACMSTSSQDTPVFFLKYEELLKNEEAVVQKRLRFMGASEEESSVSSHLCANRSESHT
jgi:hypothetical protein